MYSSANFLTAVVAVTCLGSGALTAQAPPSANSATISGTQAEAVREHLDEAEDLVDSLLRWQHVVAWRDQGKLHAPPPEGPSTTLISIEQGHAQKLSGLLEALVAQVPPSAKGNGAARGDLRAHAEKAQQIAKELQPPQATSVQTAAAGSLVTVDRTALERLNVELDAMEMLLPRSTK